MEFVRPSGKQSNTQSFVATTKHFLVCLKQCANTVEALGMTLIGSPGDTTNEREVLMYTCAIVLNIIW